MLDGESDDELMTRVAAGDHAAFRALMGRHMSRALRVAETVVHNRVEADDIAQEAFIRVWRNAAGFDRTFGRFTTWLHRIVINLAIDSRRRNRVVHVELPEEIPLADASALDGMIASERQDAVHRALAEMPERQRAAVALFHVEGLSGRESAQAMQLSESAFESLLTRARSALRQRVLATLDYAGGNNEAGGVQTFGRGLGRRRHALARRRPRASRVARDVARGRRHPGGGARRRPDDHAGRSRHRAAARR